MDRLLVPKPALPLSRTSAARADLIRREWDAAVAARPPGRSPRFEAGLPRRILL